MYDVGRTTLEGSPFNSRGYAARRTLGQPRTTKGSTPKGVPQQWQWATPSGSMLVMPSDSVGSANPRLLRGDVFNVLTANPRPVITTLTMTAVQRPRRGRLSIAAGRNDLRTDGRWLGERPRRGHLSIAAGRNDLRYQRQAAVQRPQRGHLSIAAGRNDLRIDGRWWGERPRRGRLSIAAGRNDLRIVGMVGESTPKGVPQQRRWATPSGSMLPTNRPSVGRADPRLLRGETFGLLSPTTFACSVGRADPRLLRGDVFNVLTAAVPPSPAPPLRGPRGRLRRRKIIFFF